jgi:hypothetical protein
MIVHHCALTDPTNCHTHLVQTLGGVASGVFTTPDHDYPSYLEIRLGATDLGGLTNMQSVSLQPQTVALTFQTAPVPGLKIGFGSSSDVAPFTRTVIVNSSSSVSASSTQNLATQEYGFVSWSDGGVQNHLITAPASPATYTATYRLEPVISSIRTSGLGRGSVTISWTTDQSATTELAHWPERSVRRDRA